MNKTLINFLCLYSHKEDPVVNAIQQDPLLREKIKLLSLSEFLFDVEVNDSIKNNKILIKWKLKDGKFYTSENTYIINRLHSLEHRKIIKNLNSYTARELYAYFIFSLSQFKKSLNSSNENGLTGGSPTLIEQWQKAKKLKIKHPHYYYGKQKDIGSNYIQGNLFSYYHWKVMDKKINTNDFYLHYKRPQGDPVFLYKFNKTIWVHSQNKDQLTTDVNKKIKNYGQSLSKTLNKDICEILFFVNNNKITFGSMNTFLINIKNKNDFNYIQTELKAIYANFYS